MKITTLAALCVVSLLALENLRADDLQPPPWRGGPLSTVAEWDFLTGNPGPPDGTSVAPVVGDGGGTPLAAPDAGLNWIPFDGSGGWMGGPAGGTMNFEIPNWIDNEPVKFLWIQLTYQAGVGPVSVSNITAFDPLGISSIINTSAVDIPITGGAGAPLFHRIETWEIRPNPDRELIQVFIPANAVLSQAVIDTISVPEPSSLMLATLAAMFAGAVVWRARRARA